MALWAKLARHILLNRVTYGMSRRVMNFLNRNISDSPLHRAKAQAKKLERQSAQSDKLRRQLDRAEQQVRASQQRIRETQERVRKTQDRLRETQDRVRNSEQKAGQARLRVNALRSQVKTLQGDLDRRKQGQIVLDHLLQGASSEDALLAVVRSAKTEVDRIAVRSIAFEAFNQPQTRSTGALLLGVFMFGDEMFAAAYHYLCDADEATVLQCAPKAYFGAWMAVDAEAGRRALMGYLHEHGATLSAERALGLVNMLGKYRFYDDLRAIMQIVPSLQMPPDHTDAAVLQKIHWLRDRLAAADTPPPIVDGKQINLAIMDYKLLDRDSTSSNRGDYVQTLASLANICRFQDVTFAGDTPLAALLEGLKSDIHPDRRLDAPAATVVPVPLDRDFASGRTYHPDTWLICNGWFMHRNVRGKIDFPFPDTINPIFISFHINDPDVLNPEVVSELRKFEPIGCRDWTTVYRLRDYGISCFFSGCLTTTIGQILPPAENLPQKRLAAVETHVDASEYPGWEITQSSQVGDYVRDFTLTEGILDAKDMLISYLDYSKIQTLRLHCYLPCRSMGFPVDFRPRNRSDIRFEGLLDLNAEDFSAIRSGIEEKLETILSAIFAGQTRDEVMALWRQICAPDVAAAEAYCNRPLPADPVTDISQALASIQRRTSGPLHQNATELAFALDENLADYLPAVLHSVVAHTSGPINVHLIYRGLDQDFLRTIERAFPEIAFQMLNFNDVDYGSELRLLSHTTQSTLDRLYLPEVLEDVKKVLYLDIDILVREDLRKLFDLDLEGHVLAGKFSTMRLWQNAVRLMTRASLKLAPQQAWEMRRRLHRTITVPARTFNAGVIVMDIARMRAENFTAHNLYLVTQCYCNDQDALNIYAAGNVQELESSWNFVPSQEYNTDPKIIHWAGRVKPWSPQTVSLWQAEFDAAMAAGGERMKQAGLQDG